MENTTHVVVIGAGAAGSVAAQFIARAKFPVTVIDSGRSTMKRALLGNFPGIPKSNGTDVLSDFKTAAEAEGAKFITEPVTHVEPHGLGQGMVVHTDSNKYWASHLIVASGQGSLKLLPDLRRTSPRQPYVKVNLVTSPEGRTSTPGIWAAGVITGCPSQVVICAGSGATAALDIVSEITGEYWVDHETVTE